MSLKLNLAKNWIRLRSTLVLSGHRIKSGLYPLYHLVVVSFFLGSMFQIAVGPPPSIADQLDAVLMYMYIAGQLFGSICVLIAIQFMRDTPTAARIERFGLSWLFAAVIIYFGSVCIDNEGLPASTATYVILAIGVYFFYRILEITKNLQTLGRIVSHQKTGDRR